MSDLRAFHVSRLILISICCSQTLAGGEDIEVEDWSMLSGSQITNQHALISTTEDHQSHPGASSGRALWQDLDGTVWVFGGEGFDDHASNNSRLLTDFWTYNTSSNTWAVVKPDHYKTHPPRRKSAAACGVHGLMFMMFGGQGQDHTVLNDTWLFYRLTNKWIQVTVNNSGSSSKSPPGRYEASSWCTKDHLYIRGGMGKNNTILNDFWAFSLKQLDWTEIRTAQNPSDIPHQRNGAMTWVGRNKLGKYDGNLYLFGGNIKTPEQKTAVGYIADMWRYSVQNKTWSFLNGVWKTLPPINCIVHYSAKNSSHSHPGCRKSGGTWVDSDGHLWLFGGQGVNKEAPTVFTRADFLADLWKFDLDKNIWIWMGGGKDTEHHQHETSDEFDKSELNDHPSERMGFVTWSVGKNFYLFGGQGHDIRNKAGFLNDLWVFHSAHLTEKSPDSKYSPGLIFMICLSTTAGVFLLLGLNVFLMKYCKGPRHAPSGGSFGRVRYSALQEMAVFDD